MPASHRAFWALVPLLSFLGMTGACTGDDPVLPPTTSDAGAPETSSPSDGASGSDATVDVGTDSPLIPGERRACPAAKAVTQAAGDRVVFEPSGVIVDETGRFVAWEESRTKKRAVPENPSAGGTTVVGCCPSFATGGGLVFASIPELDVADQDFAIHTLVKRRTAGAPSAGGGAMIVKKPTSALPFTGFALTVAGRDPNNGLEDKPAFQLQYQPRIAAIAAPGVGAGTFVGISGYRDQATSRLAINVAGAETLAAYDAVSVSNADPMFIGGGGDTHFLGEVCVLVLEVGGQTQAKARAATIAAYTP